MTKTNQQIGRLIAQIRQERNLTQAEFAKRLHTSQPAINRIEHGGQNLSLDMLGRISQVLNKQLVSLSTGAVNLRIEGGHELHGSIKLKNSKNAAVHLLCASLLNYGVTRLTACPRIEEVYRIIEVLESIGVHVRWLAGNDLEIHRPAKLKLDQLNAESARKTRSIIMLIGALMHDEAMFQVPYAGGCELGRRTVAPHLYALQQFGVSITTTSGTYEAHVTKKEAGRVVLYEAGDTVTTNALLAAARTPGQTIIQFTSANYAIQDVCHFLQKLGVEIGGIGTTVLTVKGVPYIKQDITYALTEDPIEAMFFTAAVITTNSEITIERVPIDFMALELLKLQKMGLEFDVSERFKAANGYIDLVDLTIHKHHGHLRAPVEKIHPNVYPVGVNADALPYFVPIVAVAKGRTLIHDWMFENRAIYYTELTKVGASVELADPHRIYVDGPTKFRSADVVCPPALRPASLLLIAMLAAPGISTLRNVYTINRGYEDLAERLNALGAHITVLHDF